MAIHLIPFVAGAVLGGLGAYFYRDEKLRREVKRTAGDLGGKVRKTADQVSGKVSAGFGELREKVAPQKADHAPAPKVAKEEPVAKKKSVAKKKLSAKKD